MEERSPLVIHVMPAEFFDAEPLRRHNAIPPRTLFIIGVAGALVAVIAGAAWYFTADLRAKPTAIVPLVAAPEPPPPLATPAAPPEIPTVPAQPVPAAPPPSPLYVDTDADGLTDAEEEALKTNPSNPDSDNDGFLDGHVVINLYSPAGFEAERLVDAGLVKEYTDPAQRIRFYYPTPWTATPTDTTGREVVVAAPNGDSVTITVLDNPTGQTAAAWYAANTTAAGVAVGAIKTKAGVAGIATQDGHTAYLASSKQVVSFRYASTADGPPLYPHIVAMMEISLVFSMP